MRVFRLLSQFAVNRGSKGEAGRKNIEMQRFRHRGQLLIDFEPLKVTLSVYYHRGIDWLDLMLQARSIMEHDVELNHSQRHRRGLI